MVPFSRFAIAVVIPQIVVGVIRWIIYKTYKIEEEDPEDKPIVGDMNEIIEDIAEMEKEEEKDTA